MSKLNFNDVLSSARYAIQDVISEEIKKSKCNKVNIVVPKLMDISFVKDDTTNKWKSPFYGDNSIGVVSAVIVSNVLRYGFDNVNVELSKVTLNGCKTSTKSVRSRKVSTKRCRK